MCLEAVKENRYAVKFIDKEKFPDTYAYYKLLYN